MQVKGRMRTVTRKVKEQVSTSLTIPSDYIANGAVYKVNVAIAVTGCPKAKVAKKAKRKAKRAEADVADLTPAPLGTRGRRTFTRQVSTRRARVCWLCAASGGPPAMENVAAGC